MYYAADTTDPTNNCLICTPTISTTAWQMQPFGHSCYGTGQCPSGGTTCECSQYTLAADIECAPTCFVSSTSTFYLQGQREGSCMLCWNGTFQGCSQFGSGCTCVGGLGEPGAYCNGQCTGVDLDP